MRRRPHWLQWDYPNSPPKLPSLSTITTLHLIRQSLDRPQSPPKRYPQPISRFATIHFLDKPTLRPTDKIGDSCVPRTLTLILIVNDALKTHYGCFIVSRKPSNRNFCDRRLYTTRIYGNVSVWFQCWRREIYVIVRPRATVEYTSVASVP